MISLCMIVKDEESNLDECLSIIKDHVDEIIIVDTGSSDSTKDIARRYTKKIYDYTWDDDFSSARNFSLSKAKGEWILVLDADERLIAPERIRKLPKEFDGFYLIQRNRFDDDHIDMPALRFFRAGYRFKNTVHEVISGKGKKIAYTDIIIDHDVNKNDFAARQLKYLEIASRQDDPKSHAIAGAIYLKIKKEPDKALEHFKKAKGYDRHTCLEGIASCYIQKKEYSKAYPLLKEIIDDNKATYSVILNMANILYMHDKKKSLQFFRWANSIRETEYTKKMISRCLHYS